MISLVDVPIYLAAAVSRRVIGEGEIIINRFRDSYELSRISFDNRIVGKLFDCIHRIIAAYVNKTLYIKFIKNFEYFFVGLDVFMNLRQFIAAGAEIGGRGPL